MAKNLSIFHKYFVSCIKHYNWHWKPEINACSSILVISKIEKKQKQHHFQLDTKTEVIIHN